jgi:hypothetical protein
MVIHQQLTQNNSQSQQNTDTNLGEESSSAQQESPMRRGGAMMNKLALNQAVNSSDPAKFYQNVRPKQGGPGHIKNHSVDVNQ